MGVIFKDATRLLDSIGAGYDCFGRTRLSDLGKNGFRFEKTLRMPKKGKKGQKSELLQVTTPSKPLINKPQTHKVNLTTLNHLTAVTKQVLSFSNTSNSIYAFSKDF